jgi:hypothetical protein
VYIKRSSADATLPQDILEDLSKNSDSSTLRPVQRINLLCAVRSVIAVETRNELVDSSGGSISRLGEHGTAALKTIEPLLVAGHASHILSLGVAGPKKADANFFPISDDRYVRLQHSLIIISALIYLSTQAEGEPSTYPHAVEYDRLASCAAAEVVKVLEEYRRAGREGERIAEALEKAVKQIWNRSSIQDLFSA